MFALLVVKMGSGYGGWPGRIPFLAIFYHLELLIAVALVTIILQIGIDSPPQVLVLGADRLLNPLPYT